MILAEYRFSPRIRNMWRPLVLYIIAVLFYMATAHSDNSALTADHYPLDLKCELGLQSQINEELHASLVYMGMAAHFDKNSVARKGFSAFYRENSLEERSHAQELIDYINKRAGTVKTFNLIMPKKFTWEGALESLEDAVKLEKKVNEKLYILHTLAQETCLDPHLTHFLEEKFLTAQVNSIDLLLRYIAIIKAMDTGMGEYLLDRQLLEELSYKDGKSYKVEL